MREPSGCCLGSGGPTTNFPRSAAVILLPGLVQAQCPVRGQCCEANDLVVLPDHLLGGGTREEVQVNQTTNHPAMHSSGHVMFNYMQVLCG